jgi:purine-binding chemotaxis protein CheW
MLDRNGLSGVHASASATRSHLLTRVDRYDLAFPIEDVISVHEAPIVTAVPSARPGVLGGVRVHGEAVPVADIRRCLRLAPRAVTQTDRLLLVRAGGRTVGIVVDEVKSLIDVPTNALGGPDSIFEDTPINTQVIAGISASPELCAVVDVEGLLLPDPWDDVDAERLLDHAVDENTPLAERTAALAARPAQEAEPGIEAAVFLLGGQRYAVPVASVIEFFRDLPHAPLVVRGGVASLVNRRGDALALYDVRQLLGLQSEPLPATVDGIVLVSGGLRIAIAVEGLAGLETLSHTAASAAHPGRFTQSIHTGPNGAVQLIDVAALLAAPQLVIGSEVAP